ncbi:hypothetical protein EB155_08360 [archaeon]|nr:hypothetical protein [archaeon]
MNKLASILSLAALVIIVYMIIHDVTKDVGSTISKDNDDFYGIVQEKPKNNLGVWVVGNQRFTVTRDTEIDEDYESINIGSCVEIDIENNRVKEIESRHKSRCINN